MFYVDKNKKSISLQIFEHIRDQILTGALKPGQNLLPIRELAKELNVSKNTVNSAYVSLVEEGYVYSVHGSGYFVEKQEQMKTAINTERNVKYDLTKSFDAIKVFPWEKWEKCVSASLGNVRRNIANKDKLYSASNELIRQSICNDIQKIRGIEINPHNVLLCRDMYEIVTCVSKLFSNLSKYITFLEPSDPAFRTMFQEDFFQVREMNRRMSKKDVNASGENAFKVVFGYLEQYLEEFKREYPYNMWLKEWTLRTGSYIVIFDNKETGTVDLSQYDCLEYDKVLFVGNYDRLLPEEISITYLILPDKLMQKLRNQQNKNDKVYPLSYQLALADIMNTDEIFSCIEQNRKIRLNRRIEFSKLLENVFKKYARYMEEYFYISDGIPFSMNTSIPQRQVLLNLQRNDIAISGAEDYWYFEKEKGRNIFVMSYNDYSEEVMYKILNEIKNEALIKF